MVLRIPLFIKKRKTKRRKERGGERERQGRRKEGKKRKELIDNVAFKKFFERKFTLLQKGGMKWVLRKLIISTYYLFVRLCWDLCPLFLSSFLSITPVEGDCFY